VVIRWRMLLLSLLVGGCPARPLGLSGSLGDPTETGDPMSLDMQPPDLSPPPAYCGRIYVLSDTGELAFFDPVQIAFHPIEQLACPAMGGTRPYSIAIDRAGMAWVEYRSGELF